MNKKGAKESSSSIGSPKFSIGIYNRLLLNIL